MKKLYTIGATFFLLAIILLTNPSIGKSENIYKFVDENGVLHFSNFVSDKRYRPLIPPKKQKKWVSQTHIYKIIDKAAYLFAVDAALIKAVVKAESNFNPKAVSHAGAMGLMQLMPETADILKVSNPFDPKENIYGGVRYLKKLMKLFDGDVKLSLAAYNAGRSSVLKYGGIPPYKETKEYVKKVLNYFGKYKKVSLRRNKKG